jgi:copper chaperone CopZ
MAQVVFEVPELHCEGCARSIREGIGPAPGARAVEIDVARRLRAEMERLARRQVVWTSSMVLAGVGLAFAAGRLAF